MQKAQDGIAVPDRRVELVARQAQILRDRLQNPRAQMVQRPVKPGLVLTKTGHFLRPDIGRHQRGQRMARRQVAADMPELFQIMQTCALGGFLAEGRIAALAAHARDVAALDVLGQGEQRLGVVHRQRDPVLVQVGIGDHGKAIALERGTQFARETVEIAAVQPEGNGCDAGHGVSFSALFSGMEKSTSTFAPVFVRCLP